MFYRYMLHGEKALIIKEVIRKLWPKTIAILSYMKTADINALMLKSVCFYFLLRFFFLSWLFAIFKCDCHHTPV